MFFLRVIAFLPLGVLYAVSNAVWLFIFYIARYRRKVVRDNLTLCFPEKTEREIRQIESTFYRNFCDYIFETIKLLHISNDEICRRITFSNVAIMDDAIAAGKDVVVYFSHMGNWEWAPSVRLHSRFNDDDAVCFGQIYRPLRNPVIDSIMLKIRDRFHTMSIPKSLTLRQLVSITRKGDKFVVGFMSDQKPSHGDPVRIVSFFGRPTAVITGTETLARRMGTAVVYWKMTKPKRGHYHIEVVPMADDASRAPEGHLTARYFELLEDNIRQSPTLWLWTHKRWKTSPRSWSDVHPSTLISVHTPVVNNNPDPFVK